MEIQEKIEAIQKKVDEKNEKLNTINANIEMLHEKIIWSFDGEGKKPSHSEMIEYSDLTFDRSSIEESIFLLEEERGSLILKLENAWV